jgi:hypothetical protein
MLIVFNFVDLVYDPDQDANEKREIRGGYRSLHRLIGIMNLEIAIHNVFTPPPLLSR